MAAAPGLRWDAGHMASGGKATTVDALLEALWDAKGTDLLLTVGAFPLVRVDGALRPVDGAERKLGRTTRRPRFASCCRTGSGRLSRRATSSTSRSPGA